MSTKIKISLSTSSIQSAINEIKRYKSDLQSKCELFVKELAQCGIQVAQTNVGSFGKYITFTVNIEQNTYGCKAIMIATNTGIIKSEWKTKDGVKSADISPLLMCEFGSGLKAENPKHIAGVGTGTFPNQTHAEDPNGWWYMDLQGKWHHSFGITPKMPMYKASLEITSNIIKTARTVFGGG